MLMAFSDVYMNCMPFNTELGSVADKECIIFFLGSATSSPMAVQTDLCGTRWQLYEKS